MNSRDVRKSFLDFFVERDHRLVPSSPLVLPNDPTLLFANADSVTYRPDTSPRRSPHFACPVIESPCLGPLRVAPSTAAVAVRKSSR